MDAACCRYAGVSAAIFLPLACVTGYLADVAGKQSEEALLAYEDSLVVAKGAGNLQAKVSSKDLALKSSTAAAPGAS